MGDGWQVDIAAAQAVVDGTANAGSSMQTAAIDVDAALRDVVTALADTEAVGAAQVFLDARQGDATAAVRSVARAITAATGAMTAFAHADADMASDTAVASSRADGARQR